MDRFNRLTSPPTDFTRLEKGGANRLARNREKISLAVEQLAAPSK